MRSSSENGNMSRIEYVNLEQGAEEEMQTLIQVYNSMIHRIQVQIQHDTGECKCAGKTERSGTGKSENTKYA